MKTYSLRKQILREKLEGKTVLFDSGKSVLYTLNETASLILKQVLLRKTPSEIVAIMTKKYDKTPRRLKKDIDNCILQLVKNRILIADKQAVNQK